MHIQIRVIWGVFGKETSERSERAVGTLGRVPAPGPASVALPSPRTDEWQQAAVTRIQRLEVSVLRKDWERNATYFWQATCRGLALSLSSLLLTSWSFWLAPPRWKPEAQEAHCWSSRVETGRDKRRTPSSAGAHKLTHSGKDKEKEIRASSWHLSRY